MQLEAQPRRKRGILRGRSRIAKHEGQRLRIRQRGLCHDVAPSPPRLLPQPMLSHPHFSHRDIFGQAVIMFSRHILLYLRDPVEYVPSRGWPNRSHLLIACYSVTFLHPSSL